MVYGQFFHEECLITFALSVTLNVQHLTRGISRPFSLFPTVYIKLIALFLTRGTLFPPTIFLTPSLNLNCKDPC